MIRSPGSTSDNVPPKGQEHAQLIQIRIPSVWALEGGVVPSRPMLAADSPATPENQPSIFDRGVRQAKGWDRRGCRLFITTHLPSDLPR